MLEEQNQTLEMRRLEFAVYAVKRMRDRMSDFSALQITLKRKNVVSDEHDIGVLLFGDSPNQDVDLARVLRKISGHLFTDECVWQVANFQTAVDPFVIRDRHQIH